MVNMNVGNLFFKMLPAILPLSPFNDRVIEIFLYDVSDFIWNLGSFSAQELTMNPMSGPILLKLLI